MKKQIKGFSIGQTSKIVALLYVIFGFIYMLIGVPLFIFGEGEMRIMALVYIFMPIFMGLFGFIFMAFFCWIYNLLADRVGGIEVFVENIN